MTNSPGDDGGGQNLLEPAIIYYDGACGLCRAFKGEVEKRAASGRFEFRQLKTPVREPRGGIPPGRFESLILIDSKAGVLTGHEAVAEIAGRLDSNYYRLFGRLLLVWPMSILAGLIYRFVAANRHRLSSFFKIGVK